MKVLAYCVIAAFAVLQNVSGAYSPGFSDRELMNQINMKELKERIRPMVDQLKRNIDIACPGYGDKAENVTMEIVACSESIEKDQETICSIVKNHSRRCVNPLIIMFHECLPTKAEQLPDMFLDLIISATTNYLCKTDGEHIFELGNACIKNINAKTQRCIRRVSSQFQQYQRKGSVPSAADMCEILESLRPCFQSHLQTACGHPITRESFLSLFDVALKVCKNYEKNDIDLVDIDNYWKRPLTLNEILEEVENLDIDQELIPEEIIIFPPENGDATDEDSGEEDNVVISNLPGAQLRGNAEAVLENKDNAVDFDSEDDLPLSHFVKRQKVYRSVKHKDELEWTKNDIESEMPIWNEAYGPKQEMSPAETFFLFFDGEIMDMLVKYTNLYASTYNRVADVTVNEMRCFIDILLLSGFSCHPRREMYWENSPDTNNSLVCKAMTRNRFRHIIQNIHCCDNGNLNDNDRFSKMRPLIEVLNKKFMDLAPLQQHNSVDESMIPYYGRHPTKQFIRGKPIRWGYKLWTATNRLGYIEWFEPYQGAKTKLPEQYKDLGMGASVVLQFVDTLLASRNFTNYHIFFDNLFTSVTLLLELKFRGVKGTGTIRQNRIPKKCPIKSSDSMKKEPRGSYDFASSESNEVIVCKWHDNNIVAIASNNANVYPTTEVKRFSQKEKKVINVAQPRIIKLYNENMGGVDRADQNISLYRVSIRGKKWYFPLISHFVDMAEQNSWRIYKTNGGKLDHLSFRRSVAVGILESFKKMPSIGGSNKLPRDAYSYSRYDRMDHMILYQDRQTRCAFCHKKCNFVCRKCTVALHPKECFLLYHSK